MQLDYKICKELEKAGFSPKGEKSAISKHTFYRNDIICSHNKSIYSCHKHKLPFPKKGDSLYYIPFLEELIEACGKNGFDSLVNCGDYWRASHFANGGIEVEGKTPLEAVANLYLKLNK